MERLRERRKPGGGLSRGQGGGEVAVSVACAQQAAPDHPQQESDHARLRGPRPLPAERPRPPRARGPAHLLKSGPVFQMLVLPTQPRGGSVMFSFSRSSCTACATTPTASLMWADSFLPLMSCSPMMPGASVRLEPVGDPRPPGPARPSTHRPGRSAARSPRSRAPPPATRTPSPSCSASRLRGTRWQRRPRCGADGGDGPGLRPSRSHGWQAAAPGSQGFPGPPPFPASPPTPRLARGLGTLQGGGGRPPAPLPPGPGDPTEVTWSGTRPSRAS